MDEHVHRAITTGLRLRDVDVLTVQEDNHRNVSDAVLLDRATELGRVLFSQDEDLLIEAHRRQVEGMPFAGSFMRINYALRLAFVYAIWN
jgi:hypothetical protein